MADSPRAAGRAGASGAEPQVSDKQGHPAQPGPEEPQALALAVAEAVVAQFEALPKSGKPQPHEHTVLAGVALILPPQPPPQQQQQQQQQQGHQEGPPPVPVPQPQPQHPQHSAPQAPLVVALATGTKCLPASKRDPAGRAVNDCHAEAACRRALLRWLYTEAAEAVRLYRSGGGDGTAVLQLRQRAAAAPGGEPRSAGAAALGDAAAGGTTAAEQEDPAGLAELQRALSGWELALRPGVQLHMYASQPPCGDASILEGLPAAAAAACCSSEAGPPAAAPSGAAAVLRRTGAKPIVKRPKLSHDGTAAAGPSETPAAAAAMDAAVPPAPAGEARASTAGASSSSSSWAVPQAHEVESCGEAQAAGLARRKPGRGEATLSMSCSDKLARWRLLGLQGSLLCAFLAQPLCLSSLTATLLPADPLDAAAAAEAEAAGTSSLRRALVGRTTPLAGQLPLPFRGAAEQPLALRVLCPAEASTGSGASRLSREQLQGLGLVPGGARKVAGGSSLVWHAPPSPAILGKGGTKPAAATAASVGASGSKHSGTQQQQQQDLAAAAAGQAPLAPAAVVVVRGGTQEGISGTVGVKQGHSRKGAASPAPAAAPGISKAALLGLFWQLVGDVAALRSPQYRAPAEQQQQEEQEQQGQREQGAEAEGEPGPSGGAAGAASPGIEQLAARCSYRQSKRAAGAAYQAAWRGLLAGAGGPFEGWIPKPEELEAFTVGLGR